MSGWALFAGAILFGLFGGFVSNTLAKISDLKKRVVALEFERDQAKRILQTDWRWITENRIGIRVGDLPPVGYLDLLGIRGQWHLDYGSGFEVYATFMPEDAR